MIQYLPWIYAALAGAAIALTVIAILRWQAILDWFHHRSYLSQADRNNVGFTLMQYQQTGNYRTVQGVFNKRSNQVLDAHQIESKQIDLQTANAHAGKELVIYE